MIRVRHFLWFVVLFVSAHGAVLHADVECLQDSAIENLFRLTPNIFSGATPENENAFRELQKRGIKTIISVDGTKPDAAAATKYGMRYVHLPIGYSGFSTNRELELIKAAELLPKPIFVHCHHGKHRGPTAAALLCMGNENWNSADAIRWMRQAGTSTNYSGLFKAVETFQKPGVEKLKTVSPDFAEYKHVSSMVEAMVALDERIGNLKTIRNAGFKKSDSHPDIIPAHEALLLHELFKELLRAPETVQHEDIFLTELNAAEQASAAFYFLVKNETFGNVEAEIAFQKITQTCVSCHRKFRD